MKISREKMKNSREKKVFSRELFEDFGVKVKKRAEN
jgi:hypothetical protein